MNSTFVLFRRLMKHIFRSFDTILTVAIIPIVVMILFTFVLGGAIETNLPANTNYVDYIFPGIMLMAIASGVAYTANRLFQDIEKGFIQRLNSMPISRSAALWAHVLTSIVSNFMTLVLIFCVALIMGFRSSANVLEWLGVIAILALVNLTLTWVAMIPGLIARTAEGASAFAYPILLLPLVSSAFVPTDTMPAGVRFFAEHQPVTAMVNTIRSLLLGQSYGTSIWIALAWCVAIMVLAWLASRKLYAHKLL